MKPFSAPPSSPSVITRACWLACCLALAGCETMPSVIAKDGATLAKPLLPEIRQILGGKPAERKAAEPSAGAAPAPPPPPPAAAAAAPRPADPRGSGRQANDNPSELAPLPGGRQERRFSVVLNGASPEALFMSLLAETPLSVAVDPSVKGPISIALRDVTLREALELLRELHNLEYKVIGRHILVGPAQLQTRIFSVDYPSFNRQGRSDLRVISGSITGSGGSGQIASGGGGGASTSAPGVGNGPESSRISTSMRNDLWAEIESTVKLLIGEKEGRSVVVSPQTGNVVVRALPRELRTVADYLETTRASVQRQVMLEAKVVEVTLRDSERSGINWAAFKAGSNTGASIGMVGPGTQLGQTGQLISGLVSALPGQAIEAAATAPGSLLGLAFRTSNFAAVLDFLGTQGQTQVLSSPRIATMNNQKAVLKVGTDDFFVTNVSTTTSPVGNTTSSSPNITVQPFFSGISLDVTPHIDSNGFITLHVHPAVSTVSERNKVLNLGTQGSFTLPLASSDVNETDAVVRARDGQIIAIGGLMRQSVQSTESGLPGLVSEPLRKIMGGQSIRLTEKRELVILLKPTVIDPQRGDDDLRADALERLLEWTTTQKPIVRTETVPAAPAPVAAPAVSPVPAPVAAPAAASVAASVAAPVAPPAVTPVAAPVAAPVVAPAAVPIGAPVVVPAAVVLPQPVASAPAPAPAPAPASASALAPAPASAPVTATAPNAVAATAPAASPLAAAQNLGLDLPLPGDTTPPVAALTLPELTVLEPLPPAKPAATPTGSGGSAARKARTAPAASGSASPGVPPAAAPAAKAPSAGTDTATKALPADAQADEPPATEVVDARRALRELERNTRRESAPSPDTELARQLARSARQAPPAQPANGAAAAPATSAATPAATSTATSAGGSAATSAGGSAATDRAEKTDKADERREPSKAASATAAENRLASALNKPTPATTP